MTVQVSRRQAICWAVAIATALVAITNARSVSAEAWPTKTITVIVPFGAGSASDVIPRVVLAQVSQQVGHPIVVENRGGAGGTIGTNAVAHAKPDGYTVLASAAVPAAHSIYARLPYATLDDLVPVISLGMQPLVLVVAPSKGFKTLGDLVVAAKSSSAPLTFGSAGIGSISHLAAERLRLSAEILTQHIPFKGATEALTEVMTGRIDFMYLPLAPALPLLNSGQLVPLAVSSSKRSNALPQVPTTTEAGLPGSTFDSWVGLYLPAKTPREIVLRLYEEAAKALVVPAVQQRLSAMGVEPMPLSLEATDQYFRDYVEALVRLVKAANIQAQR